MWDVHKIRGEQSDETLQSDHLPCVCHWVLQRTIVVYHFQTLVSELQKYGFLHGSFHVLSGGGGGHQGRHQRAEVGVLQGHQEVRVLSCSITENTVTQLLKSVPKAKWFKWFLKQNPYYLDASREIWPPFSHLQQTQRYLNNLPSIVICICTKNY